MVYNPAEPRDPATGKWITMFHGTSKSLARQIEKEGLQPGTDLTTSLDAAKTYARYASGGRWGSHDKRHEGVVFEVKVLEDETRTGDYGLAGLIGDHRVITGWLPPGRFRRYVSADLSTVDLAAPGHGVLRRARPRAKVTVPGSEVSDKVVREIADVLLRSARYKRLKSDFAAEVDGLEQILAPYGIRKTAIRMALGLTHTTGGYARGTTHLPNSRLAEHEAEPTKEVRSVRDSEVYFRAAYLANAASRLQRSLNAGNFQRQALAQEAAYYREHENARRGRLRAVAQVQHAARLFGAVDERGTKVGWYLNPLLRNEFECKAANGHNFYVEEGTIIGLPGSVHNRCGCYAGPIHEGAALVNDVLSNVVKFTRPSPKFRLKKGRVA